MKIFFCLTFSIFLFRIRTLNLTVGETSQYPCNFTGFSSAILQIKQQPNPQSSSSPHILNFNCSFSVKLTFTQYFFINTSLLIDATNNDI